MITYSSSYQAITAVTNKTGNLTVTMTVRNDYWESWD